MRTSMRSGGTDLRLRLPRADVDDLLDQEGASLRSDGIGNQSAFARVAGAERLDQFIAG